MLDLFQQIERIFQKLQCQKTWFIMEDGSIVIYTTFMDTYMLLEHLRAI
jgi:hypothetical protein